MDYLIVFCLFLVSVLVGVGCSLYLLKAAKPGTVEREIKVEQAVTSNESDKCDKVEENKEILTNDNDKSKDNRLTRE
jgi:hypothetical protein